MKRLCLAIPLLTFLMVACSEQPVENKPQDVETSSVDLQATFADPSIVEFETPVVTVRESDRFLDLVLVRKQTLSTDVFVEVEIISGTAEEGLDYQPPLSSRIEFLKNESQATLRIEIVDDYDHEKGIEEFKVSIRTFSEQAIGGVIRDVTVRIEDDDKAPEPARIAVTQLDSLPNSLAKGLDYTGTAQLKNIGGQQAYIKRIDIQGEGYSIIQNFCASSLEPAQTCSVTWSFRAVRAGAKFNGSLFIEAEGSVEILSFEFLVPEETVQTDKTTEIIQSYKEEQDYYLDEILSETDNEIDESVGEKEPEEQQDGLAILSQTTVPGGVSLFSYPIDRSRILDVNKVIGCLLVNHISSELPNGRVDCQVDIPVYASSGNLILLPRGSLIRGEYGAPASETATRLQITFTEIVKPDGARLMLPPASFALDAYGRSGTPANIYDKPYEKYKSAFLVALTGAVSSIGAREVVNVAGLATDQDASEAASSLSESFASITQAELERERNNRILFIEGGKYRFLFKPVVPIVFPSSIKKSSPNGQYQITTLENSQPVPVLEE